MYIFESDSEQLWIRWATVLLKLRYWLHDILNNPPDPCISKPNVFSPENI